MALIVLADESDAAAVKVAQVVGQVGVEDISVALLAELAIARKRTLPQKVIAKRVGAKSWNDLHRVNNVAERLAVLFALAGLFVLAIDEAVAEHHPRRLKPRGEQHRRPQGAVKARNVLADEMNVGRPPFLEFLVVRGVTDASEVGQKRV